jgi:hypothetical protein
LEARRVASIVAAGLCLLAGLAATRAEAATVSVLVVPRFAPQQYAQQGAVGLFVPGAGERVSRRAALASLVRGKVENSNIGGIPGGQPLIRLGTRPGDVTVYLTLPPPGDQANDTRYPIAIVGGGYHGILTSSSTRIPGLVSIADVAPTSVAIAAGKRPSIRSQRAADAPAELARLDRRLARVDQARLAATFTVVCLALGFGLLGLRLRSKLLSRAGLLGAPASLAGALVVSGAGVTTPWLVMLLIVVLAAGASVAGAWSQRLLLPVLLAWIVGFLVVLVEWPDVNALAAIGPHPDGGGRFYGLTNLQSGVLLTVALLAARLAGLRWLPAIAALALATDGWSRAGADGGGLLMVAAAFVVLAVGLSGRRWTPRLAALVAAGTAAAGLAIVGLDAATGGSSHVTRAVRRGPGSLLAELGHRIHLSAAGVIASWHAALVFAIAIAALVRLRLSRPSFPVGDALLVGVAVSLLVNDSPTDVAAAGAVSYGVLWGWERVRAATAPAA